MASMPLSTVEFATRRRIEYVRGFGILLVIAIVGLYIVKWNPYFHRAFSAAANRSIGASIVSGKAVAAPAPSFQAAIDYGLAYFKAIWQALALGLLLAATLETLVPRDWIARVLGKTGFSTSALGGLIALPGMMCTCCSAPVVVGFRKSGASIGSATAFFLGNPTLNPAVLVFLVFTLGWKWAILRAGFGIALVLAGALMAARLARKRDVVLPQPELALSLPAGDTNLVLRWFKSLGRLFISLIPEYIVIVLLLGALRSVLFPAAIAHAGNGAVAILAVAIAATLFVIPTGGEIPIIQTLQAFGLSSGLAGVLLLTLAPLSLPSLVMLGRTFPKRVLVSIGALTVATGIACGLMAVTLGL